MPFFSIVIPTFNRSFFIENTILSVLHQSFQDFEIVVVDDGSTDDTFQKIKALKEIYGDQIKYFFQRNEERGRARNIGIKNAEGEYIVFLDSDDLMRRNHLETLYKHIQEQNNLTFLATKYELRTLETDEPLNIPLKKFQEGFYDYKTLLDGNHFACNFAVRKAKLVHLFEEDRAYASAEDWIFLMMNLQEREIFLIDELTITMIDHAGRSMKNHSSRIEIKMDTANYLLSKMRLTGRERKKLLGYAYYHCSIHSYLMFNRIEAFQFWRKSICYLGINSKIVLMAIRNFIGKENVNIIKTHVWKFTQSFQEFSMQRS